jgi:hypothetical protein
VLAWDPVAHLHGSGSVVGTNVCARMLQRICDDVPAFADTSVFLVLGIIRKFFNCVAFAGGRTYNIWLCSSMS